MALYVIDQKKVEHCLKEELKTCGLINVSQIKIEVWHALVLRSFSLTPENESSENICCSKSPN